MLVHHLLSARKVWAFGPRTARLSTAEPAKAMLKELLAGGTGATEYFIYFAPSNRRDRAFAEYFADCPGHRALSLRGTGPRLGPHGDAGADGERHLRQLMPPFVPPPRPRMPEPLPGGGVASPPLVRWDTPPSDRTLPPGSQFSRGLAREDRAKMPGSRQ